MTPNFDAAAIAATETLIKYGIDSAPIIALPILKQMPGVLVLSFSEMSVTVGVDRDELVTLFGIENQDAVTSVHVKNGKLQYIVACNQRLPFYMLQRALARELGHIVLGHDGTLDKEVEKQEALCFASYLLCPRALIHALEESNLQLTVETVGSVTGCYGRYLSIIRKFPGVHVPAGLNRAVRAQFSNYINNFIAFQSILVDQDSSPLADFGSFMDNYEE